MGPFKFNPLIVCCWGCQSTPPTILSGGVSPVFAAPPALPFEGSMVWLPWLVPVLGTRQGGAYNGSWLAYLQLYWGICRGRAFECPALNENLIAHLSSKALVWDVKSTTPKRG